jgi:23S rRNA pseudouridine2605 synthase
VPHIIPVGRLDFLSEGVMVLTNNGDLARALELPSSEIERSYRIRVFGRMFDEEKLRKLRNGFTIKGRQYGPYIIDVIKRQSTNTWLSMKLFEGKNNEIRRAMRKFSLRVNRLIRTSYGPYTIGLVPNPNDLAEVRITKELKYLLKKYFKEKTALTQSQLSKQKTELIYKEKRLKEKLEETQKGGPLHHSSKGEILNIEIDENEPIYDFDDFEGNSSAPKGLGEQLFNEKR